ncbi:MAG: ribonuclease H-related protein [Oceanotoga sp.]|uniref:ribonuclease H1 domain-containing protein n=1 Tax=Oceanotoga sp. TaxID=2108366 RepID=UPI002654AE00|nr:viroplasmin family protein [Oceanotoga sp.]MDN5343639.1 ribonuclease H-related protein [Oceanotoga sp.]
MSKKKYYAVKKGRNPGIYENWEETKKQVDKFHGAEYKGFSSLEDAKEYLGNTKDKLEATTLSNNPNKIVAYVDGSFYEKEKAYGSGIYIIHNNIEKEFYKYGNDQKFLETRNVAGEIIATLLALEYTKQNNAKEIDIYYDYTGIKNWALGIWKTTKSITKIYKIKFEEYKKHIKINFYKIKAHTNNKGNTKADLLAKKAIEEKQNNIEFDISLDNLDEINNYDKNITFKIDLSKKEDFDLLENLYKNENYEITKLESNCSIISRFKVKSKILNNYLFFNLYENNALVIQGNAYDSFVLVQMFFSKYKNYKETLRLNEEFLKANVKKTENEFESIIKNLSNFLVEEIKNLIFTAYLITKQEKMPGSGDYSFYLMPIMRATEAFLHAILNEFDIDNPDKFDMFTKTNTGHYFLKKRCKKKINNIEIENAIEECYNFYHQRHDYAHAKNEFANTKIINDPNKVNEVIMKGINNIKNTYDIYIS